VSVDLLFTNCAAAVNNILLDRLQCDLTDGDDVTATYVKRYKEPALQMMSEASVSYYVALQLVTPLKQESVALTPTPQTCSAITPDVGNVSSNSERCMVFRCRVNGQFGSDKQPYRRTSAFGE